MKNKYPFTKQEGLKDCGAACMQMIIKYYNGYISINDLNEILETTKEGVSAYNIVEGAKLLGFNSEGIKCKIEELSNVSSFLPTIAHVTINKKFDHYIVIYKVDLNKGTLLIADPQDKIKKFKLTEFKEIYNDILIIMYPVKPIEKRNAENHFKNYILTIIKSLIKELKLLLIMSIIYMLLSVFLSFYIKVLFDKIYYTNTILTLIYIFFIISKLNQIFIHYLRNKILIVLNMKVDCNLSLYTFGKLLSLPYSYYRNKTTGEIVTRYTDISKIRQSLNKIILSVFLDLPLAILSFIVMYIINKELSFIALIIMILYSLVVILYNKILKRNYNKIQYLEADKNSKLVESIASLDTINGLKIQKFISKKFEYVYIKYLKGISKIDNVLNTQELLKKFISEIGEMTLLLIGIFYVKDNVITIGSLLAFNSMLGFFLSPIKNLLDLDYLIIESKKIVKKLSEMVYEEEEAKLIKQSGDILIENLSYSKTSKLILKDINIDISKGEKVIITGHSGSGKSTLLKILMKFYNDYEGKITINGHNIKAVDPCISYISQNEKIFSDTIYNNIVLDNSNDLNKVVELCHLDELIDSNLGYNKVIEEDGFNISGGQKQRIVLARTLLKDFEILLIDEGMNQIDINLERKILKKIFNIYKDKTIIIVSHRLENLDLFDRLITIEKGIITRNIKKNGRNNKFTK